MFLTAENAPDNDHTIVATTRFSAIRNQGCDRNQEQDQQR
jgi:hypothetical protein